MREVKGVFLKLNHVFTMVKNKKCEKKDIFTNLYGEKIVLCIQKVGQCVNIKILHKNSAFVYRRSVFLTIVVVCNLCCILLNILSLNICIVLFAVTLVCLFRLCHITKEESLLIVKCLGVQIKTKYVLGTKSLFIPFEKIERVFINEVFYHHRVIYLLTVMTKESGGKLKLFPLFLETLPNVKCLHVIYKYLKE